MRGGLPRGNAVSYVQQKHGVNRLSCVCAIDRATLVALCNYWAPGVFVTGVHEMVANALLMERPMSAKMKVAAAALAVLTLGGAVIATSNPAEAKPKWGPAAGIGLAAGTLIGVAAASSAHATPYGFRRCQLVRQYDMYGFYVGTARVCNYY